MAEGGRWLFLTKNLAGDRTLQEITEAIPGVCALVDDTIDFGTIGESHFSTGSENEKFLDKGFRQLSLILSDQVTIFTKSGKWSTIGQNPTVVHRRADAVVDAAAFDVFFLGARLFIVE